MCRLRLVWLQVCTLHNGGTQRIDQRFADRLLAYPPIMQGNYMNTGTVCASLNNRKKMKAEPSRMIPRKHTENLKLLTVVRLQWYQNKNIKGGTPIENDGEPTPRIFQWRQIRCVAVKYMWSLMQIVARFSRDTLTVKPHPHTRFMTHKARALWVSRSKRGKMSFFSEPSAVRAQLYLTSKHHIQWLLTTTTLMRSLAETGQKQLVAYLIYLSFKGGY